MAFLLGAGTSRAEEAAYTTHAELGNALYQITINETETSYDAAPRLLSKNTIDCVTAEYSNENIRCLSPTKWLSTEYSEYSNVVFIAVVSQDKMKASHWALQVSISDQIPSEGK